MKDPDLFDLNPCTQGKVHPLQGDREVFLGYLTERIFYELKYKIKRIVRDAADNPYVKLHESIRPYPVFVDRNEALGEHYRLYVTGTADLATKERVRQEFREKHCKFMVIRPIP